MSPQENASVEVDQVVAESVYRFFKRKKFTMGVEGEEESLGVMEEVPRSLINYDIMQGRPSVTVEIAGLVLECLLNTGARINVMSWNIVKMLKDVVIEECEEKLKCANDSRLETMGRTTIEVKLEDMKKKFRFIIVKSVSPDIIGGIDLQRQFGLCYK